MELPGLTENEILEGASAESFRRGQEYYEGGMVLSLARRGNVVEAEVAGSQAEPYNVRVEFDEGGVIEALCDCPYSWGGWCKHIVAVLLFCLDQPGEVEERVSLEQLLADLDRDQLQVILLDLAREGPRLATAIESRVAFLAATSVSTESRSQDPSGERRTAVDPAPIRRRVRDAVRSVDYWRGWDSDSQVADAVAEVSRVLDQAWSFIRAGDGPNALIVLEAITAEYLAGYDSLEDSYGHASGLYDDLGSAWAEALLSSDLNSEERDTWAKKLGVWQQKLDDYGLDETLDVAMEAAEQGWDFPPLQRILRDGVTEIEEPEVEGAVWDDALVTARLNVLERQGRHQEHLNLARAAGHRKRYADMLVRMGRVDEAVEYGLHGLVEAEEALALAKALREKGHAESALEVAQQGLAMEGRKGALASWLRDLAAAIGRPEQALSAALVAFEEEQSLDAFLRAQDLAGEGWAEIRGGMLDRLRGVKSYYPRGAVDVFLHEGLIDDAIAAVSEGATHTLVEQVVDAAMETRPDWVILACRGQAESIMDDGKTQYCGAATEWVRKALHAYRLVGREEEGRTYLQELLARHSRKYKLVPMLKRLAA